MLCTFARVVCLLAVLGVTVASECAPAKLCFAIDESSSIDDFEWKQQTDALIAVTKAFNKRAVNSTYAAAGFSGNSTINVGLSDIVSRPTQNVWLFLRRLRENDKFDKWTSSGRGLRECQTLIEDLTAPRVILLFTDGVDNRLPFGVDVEASVKAAGITIAVVGVGNYVNVHDLQNVIASRPELYTSVSDFSDFASKTTSIADSICVPPTPSATPSATPATTSPSPSLLRPQCSICTQDAECDSGLCHHSFCNVQSTFEAYRTCWRYACDRCEEDGHCRSRVCVDGLCLKARWDGDSSRCLTDV